MQMKWKHWLPAMMLVAMVSFTGCGPKDAKIKTNAETALNANPETSGLMVEVNKGVATLTGEVPSESAKAAAENAVKNAKGVKEVVNNLMVSPPVMSAPVEVTTDDALSAAVRDAMKDHPGVTATVSGGTITLTGSASKDENRTLMMKLNALQPGKIDNQLTIN